MNKENSILFYKTNEPYGCFANFSRHGINLDEEFWPTTEHYFQAQKFVGTEHKQIVHDAKTPGDAARLGRDRERPLRADWESVKDDAMRRAVKAKFEQHEEIREILLNTGDAELVENTTDDHYWGIGSRGDGKNMLGIILMEVRAQLREKTEK